MLIEIPSGQDRPVLIPGNPIKMSRVAEGPLRVYPAQGADSDQVLIKLLGMKPEEIDGLRRTGALG